MATLIIKSLLITTVIVGAILGQSHAETSENICNTDGCHKTATEILNNMDNSVNPCDNFYKFSCGGFLKTRNMSDDEMKVTAATIVYEKIELQLKSILEEESPPNERKPFTLARNSYKACMNEAAIESQGREYLQRKLKEMGGWPVLEGDEWDENKFEWTESVHKFRVAGYPETFFLNFDVTRDLMDSNTKVLDLDQPPLSHENLKAGIDDAGVKAYYKYMVNIAVILGASRSKATAELKESLEFEIALAKICVSNEARRNRTLLHNPMTVAELSEKYPNIPWKQYINNILAPYVTIEDNERVNVRVPSFMSEFVKLMSKTPKRVQANYAMWQAVGYSVKYLTQAMRNEQLEYMTELRGTTSLQPRWKTCISNAKTLFSTHALYIKKYFSEAARRDGADILADIRREFDKILKHIDWMDDETRNNALDKNKAILSFVGYPDELLDDGALEELYKNLEFSNDNYLENQLKLDRYFADDLYSKYRKPVDTKDWRSRGNVAVVNAFYNNRKNSITIPAGILHDTFFDIARPKYMNYGAIGSIIGHEITHAFDNNGGQFDKNGNVRNWWSSTTTKNYREKVQCIVDQYNNYTVAEIGKTVNGLQTKDENIADIGGYKIAYMAYNEWSQTHEAEPTLPGLQFSPKQMFWISGANAHCAKYRPKYLESIIRRYPHSPEEFRIIGSLANQPEFAADFNCPIGSNMNPANRCSFW